MPHRNWILAVLEDLRLYSEKHGLPELGRQLELARRIATRELPAGREGAQAGDISGGSGDPG
ncbi:hypothetical protein [Antarcticimicrobium luteum]|uniref:Uncharacterized protein n=1 Tax=Antarcticimicrobium luteum TaxID=2547397 RepID=A0A4R5UT26_9RHOB|nr:hypothetical protein [Antarcticimicrobium luteum]TDK42272.1 hypothetical protein E1832_19225 [Antarcticimicrobium luteum]